MASIGCRTACCPHNALQGRKTFDPKTSILLYYSVPSALFRRPSGSLLRMR